MKTEDGRIASGRGKWARAGVPHKDWRCVDQYDTFEAHGEGEYETCEMCELLDIRFVHVMEHDSYHELLHCGCVCAGHMEINKVPAERRDKRMRQRAEQRARFPGRKGWKVSARGTPHISVEGYHLIVVRRKGGFGVGVTPPWVGDPVWGRKTYRTQREAQFGCFDALEHMKKIILRGAGT